jgi:signal transduction histidine kinase
MGLTLFFFPPKDLGTPENSGAALKTALLNDAMLEHEFYLRDGCKSHVELERVGAILKLAQPMGDGFTVLCGETPSPAFTAILHKAITTQSIASGPDGAYWVIAYPFVPPEAPHQPKDQRRPESPRQPEDPHQPESRQQPGNQYQPGNQPRPVNQPQPESQSQPEGHQLLIAQYSPIVYRHPWPWSKLLVPFIVCGLVALLLAYSFSRPVRELRSVVRSFASGNLNARVPEAGLRMAAAGSYEIHSLMVDFNHMADRIAGLMEAQKLLLRDVSHELRSPLARLNVALELTRDEASAAAEIHLQRIEDEANQLNRLIGELLSLSSLESLHSPVVMKTVSVAQLVNSHLPNLQFEAQARGCTVTLSVIDDSSILADAELLGRAIENIVRNAIRYSPAGASVELDVDSHKEQKQPSAILRIMDRGPGVPKDMRETIFRPFVRVDSSRSGSTGGFGVGLAIAERAIHLHGGTIVAEPRPGGGLIVEVRIPIQNK